MDAQPLQAQVAAAIAAVRVKAVMIGNAAAALRGAPVTTVDFDFFYGDTKLNREKLDQLAERLHASLRRPFVQVSGLVRIDRPEANLQLDFISYIGPRLSFEGVRKRASLLAFGQHSLLVACLDDIIRSKRAAGRPRDLAVLDALKATKDLEDSRSRETS